MENKRVLLGMSGGVDSSVAALLLKEQGYEVMGITLELLAGSGYNMDANLEARNICKLLGIPHMTYHLKEEFKNKVIEPFICEYANGRTPNPCIECNKYLKFGFMYEKAKELNCAYIATGHYAKMEYVKEYKKYVLKKASNIAKDQSYVLYSISKELLGKVLFPLGQMHSKEEVRNIASKYKLKVANKPDSEDICFIPDGNYKRFLENNSNLKPTKGNIVTIDGTILGTHEGLYKYTIGQRRGLGISYKEPLFVVGFHKKENELIVGEQDKIYKKEMFVNELNFLLIEDLEEEMQVKIKTRYSSKEEAATIKKIGADLVQVIFENPVARITPGQSAVFYKDDIVVGGGKILR